MAIQSHVIYSAIVESVVVNRRREDILTKVAEVTGFVDVSLPENARPDYIAVIIADAIARKNCFEINGKVVGVPSVSVEHCRRCGKINLGHNFQAGFEIKAYLTVQLDEQENHEWVAALEASVLSSVPVNYYKLMYSPAEYTKAQQ
ncbi:hypothetical protein [Pectobacterium brasiliense]|uniref:hypothetical protein n=1 Tax=Pectobacterium brasiliense TaxID=180957 RepID=UPI0019698647|nr:hypothetical protein [Pectobacterium brasiliense]MBN3262981.1 hypothetical protein [Pectobacterium brasiliense]